MYHFRTFYRVVKLRNNVIHGRNRTRRVLHRNKVKDIAENKEEKNYPQPLGTIARKENNRII